MAQALFRPTTIILVSHGRPLRGLRLIAVIRGNKLRRYLSLGAKGRERTVGAVGQGAAVVRVTVGRRRGRNCGRLAKVMAIGLKRNVGAGRGCGAHFMAVKGESSVWLAHAVF